MKSRLRETRLTRRSWLLAGLAAPLFPMQAADRLQVSSDGDNLRVAAPGLHFLEGKLLAKLKDGDSVAYVAQLDLFDELHYPVGRARKGRFVVSYALWEEKFSVTEVGVGGARRTVEGLTPAAAESWCYASLSLSTAGLAPNVYYWLRLEMRTADARDFADESKLSLSLHDLIDFLGRKNTEVTHWGPLETRVRLADLPRMAGRGSRIG
jgi:hypothetical protein